jgi:hypothetical protein
MLEHGRELPGRQEEPRVEVGDVFVGTVEPLETDEEEDRKPVTTRLKLRSQAPKQATVPPADPNKAIREVLDNIDEQIASVEDAKATQKEKVYAVIVKAFIAQLLCKIFNSRFVMTHLPTLSQVDSEEIHFATRIIGF